MIGAECLDDVRIVGKDNVLAEENVSDVGESSWTAWIIDEGGWSFDKELVAYREP